MQHKPFSESCEQNRDPIGQILQNFTHGRNTVLEIGSGTGQHAVYFSQMFPWLNWQTSDLTVYHAGINSWINDSGLDNVKPPRELDVRERWPTEQFDLIFTANTLHIMSTQTVEIMFSKIIHCMHDLSAFLVYGPFNYHGRYTSESNARFDQLLKQKDATSSIKNFEWVRDIAGTSGLDCTNDFTMPANNRILVFEKSY